jgi:Uma2 family endonuclease
MGHEQPIADADVEGPIRHKLTVEEFLILDEAGVFGDKRVELIDGEIFDLSPTYQPHARVLSELTIELGLAVRQLGSSLRCYTPVSTRIDDHSLPMPDLMVVEDDGGDGPVVPRSVRLVIEVSASTQRHDLVKKAALYAGAGISEYWVADVKRRRVTRMHGPVGHEYMQCVELPFGAQIPSATIAGLVVDTASL